MSDELFCKLYMNIHCVVFTFVTLFSNITKTCYACAPDVKWKQAIKLILCLVK